MSRGYEKFEVGDFPLAGCFAKDGILYWGTGETFNESMDLDAFSRVVGPWRVCSVKAACIS